MSELNIIAIGGPDAGKTTYFRTLSKKEYSSSKDITFGYDLWKFKASTNIGDITLNIWDITGESKYHKGIIHFCQNIKMDAVLIFKSSKYRYSVMNEIIDALQRKNPDIYKVSIWSKSDDESEIIYRNSNSQFFGKQPNEFIISSRRDADAERFDKLTEPLMNIMRKFNHKKKFIFNYLVSI